MIKYGHGKEKLDAGYYWVKGFKNVINKTFTFHKPSITHKYIGFVGSASLLVRILFCACGGVSEHVSTHYTQIADESQLFTPINSGLCTFSPISLSEQVYNTGFLYSHLTLNIYLFKGWKVC